MLLTRSPLIHPVQAPGFSVRLACVKHAASVHPEPGSNSPQKQKTMFKKADNHTTKERENAPTAWPTSNPSRNPHTLTGIKRHAGNHQTKKYLVSTNKLGTLLSSQTTDTQESTPHKHPHTTCEKRKITRTLHSRADTHTTTNFPKEQNQVNTQKLNHETHERPQPGKQRYARYKPPKPHQTDKQSLEV